MPSEVLDAIHRREAEAILKAAREIKDAGEANREIARIKDRYAEEVAQAEFLALSPAEQRNRLALEKARAEEKKERMRLMRESDPEAMRRRAEAAEQLAEMEANEEAYQSQLQQERAKAAAIAEQSDLAGESLTPQEKALAKAKELAAKDPRVAKMLAEAEAKRRGL